MRLNSLKPKLGAKLAAKRVGRGIGCNSGKTCGRGHKGQKSRRGSYRRIGFEGGQMPIQRRLPKVGFNSRLSLATAEIRLQELAKLDAEVIDLSVLASANLVAKNTLRAKIIASGKLEKAISVKGLGVTKGALAAIMAAGGTVIKD